MDEMLQTATMITTLLFLSGCLSQAFTRHTIKFLHEPINIIGVLVFHFFILLGTLLLPGVPSAWWVP